MVSSDDDITKRIYELVSPWNAMSWLTFKVKPLTGDTSLNHTMDMDEEEAQDLLEEIFEEFNMDPSELYFPTYFPMHRRKEAKPLTIDMLIASAKAGRWLYD